MDSDINKNKECTYASHAQATQPAIGLRQVAMSAIPCIWYFGGAGETAESRC